VPTHQAAHTDKGEDVETNAFFFFQAEDGIRYFHVTGVQTCALPICTRKSAGCRARARAWQYAEVEGATRAQRTGSRGRVQGVQGVKVKGTRCLFTRRRLGSYMSGSALYINAMVQPAP